MEQVNSLHSEATREELVPVASELMLVVVPALTIPAIVIFALVQGGVDLGGLPKILPTFFFQILLLTTYLYYQRKGEVKKIDRNSSTKGMFWSLKQWLLAYGAIVGVGLLITVLFSSSVKGRTVSVYESLFSTPLDAILVTLSAVIMAPIVEELIFRKYLMDRLEKVTTPLRTLFLSSLLFSMLHWLDDILGSSIDFAVSHILSTFLLGLLMGWVYQSTGDIRNSIFIHATNNFIGFSQILANAIFPVSASNQDQFLNGNTDGLSQTVITYMTIRMAVTIFIIVVAGISAIWAIIRFLRNFKSYLSNFKTGLLAFWRLLTPNDVYVTVYGLLGFVIIPLLFTLFGVVLGVEGSIMSILGYILVYTASIVILRSRLSSTIQGPIET